LLKIHRLSPTARRQRQENPGYLDELTKIRAKGHAVAVGEKETAGVAAVNPGPSSLRLRQLWYGRWLEAAFWSVLGLGLNIAVILTSFDPGGLVVCGLVLIACLWRAVRIWRCDLTVSDSEVVVHNPVQTYRLAWSEVESFADSYSAIGDAMGGWALQIVLRGDKEIITRPLRTGGLEIAALREAAAGHGVKADVTGQLPAEFSPPPTPPERILDQAEAKRKWRRRLVIAWFLVAGAVIWNFIGIKGAVSDYGVAFSAGVQSQQCSDGRCSVDLQQYTQPNGEVVTDDHYDGVSASRIHVRPDGSRYMTLYWFSSDDSTATDNQFWSDVWGGTVSDAVIGLILFAVLFSGRHIRRQAKQRPTTTWYPDPELPL
jgi:hypothetical protein